MRNKQLAIGAMMLACLAGGASAHHSFAMFDQTRTIRLKGTVREFQWVNPHTWVQLMVPTGGKTVEWSIEGRSPNGLARRGWTRKTLEPGDNVTLIVKPLKNGKPGGAIVRVVFADGRELNADTPTAVDTDEEGVRR
ncbi:DUF6152 family protein [Tsuneonella sp. HG222]